MRPVVERYLPSFAGGDRLRSSQLQLAVEQWLFEVANNVEDRPREPEQALAKTGFLESIRGGRVVAEFAV
jgi:hypothetical protein